MTDGRDGAAGASGGDGGGPPRAKAPDVSPGQGTVSHYRRVLKHGVVYGIGNVARRLVGFLLLPIISRQLMVEEIGAWEVITTTVALLATVLNMGMMSSIFRFYFRGETPEEKGRVVASAFSFLTVFSLVVLLAIWFVRGPVNDLVTGSPTYLGLFEIALIGVFFEVGLFTPMALMRAREQSMRFAVLAVVRLVVNLGLSLYFMVGLGLGAYGVVLGNTVSSGALYLAFLPSMLRSLRAGVSRPLVRRMLRYGAPLMVATLGTFFLEYIDRWLLTWMRGLDEVGLYGIVYRIPKALSIAVVQPFFLAWPAVMWSLERKPEGPRVYARVLTYAVAVAAVMALAVSLFRGELITIILGYSPDAPDPAARAAFADMAWVVPWIVFSYVFSIAYFVLNTGVSLVERTEFMAVALGIAVAVKVGLAILVIPEYGMRGAAVTTFIAFGVMALCIGWFSQRLRPLPFEWGRLAWLGVGTLMLVLVGLGVERIGGGVGFGLRIAVLVLYPLIVLNPWFLRSAERAALARATAWAQWWRSGT